jgi:hypothetical protein
MWPLSIPGDGEFVAVAQSTNDPSLIEEITFRTVSGYTTLLVGNCEIENQYRDYYENALNTKGVTYNYWDRNFAGFRNTDLIYFDYLFMYTGDRELDIVTGAEEQTIMGFLNSGGRFFITGQGVASALENTMFLEEGLGVRCEMIYAGDLTVNGVNGDPIGDSLTFAITGGDGANNQTGPDVISCVNGSVPIFNYISGDGAGSRFSYNNYQVAFLAFGLEAIDNANDRNVVVSRIFDWFGYVVSVDDDITYHPDDFELLGNYPNPFNAQTTIEYSIASAASVKIDIYDIRGRLVDTIFSGFTQAGHNSVVWNADNYGSGVYFSRVQAGNSFDTRKLVLLK